MKLKWKISAKPTGRYRSFDNRSWPRANFPNEKSAAYIYCDNESYSLSKAKTGNHPELTIRIAAYGYNGMKQSEYKWLTLKQRAKTLTEAKELASKFFDENPNLVAKD